MDNRRPTTDDRRPTIDGDDEANGLPDRPKRAPWRL
jgi:hypothetical protein